MIKQIKQGIPVKGKRSNKTVTLDPKEKGGVPQIYTLTEAEVRLLNVLRDTASVDMTVDQRCQKAGISRPTYYTVMGKEAFRRAIKDTVDRIIYASLIPTAHRLAEKAVLADNVDGEGSPRGESGR